MLNKEEIQATLQLLDIALRAQGSNVAEAVVHLSRKLKAELEKLEIEENGE